MVGMSMSFGSPDYQTPHGGAPFHGWKKGFGFGKAAGPGGYVQNPANPEQLRYTPSGDRGLASSAFWRTKWEVGQASSFGIGDRPDYGRQIASVAPNNYGDVAKLLVNAKANATRNITMKARFDSFEEKKKQNPSTGGPGPAKYNTSYATGTSSLTRGSKIPSYGMGCRPVLDAALLYSMNQPGPDAYHTAVKCGSNSKIKHGTLYDITCGGKLIHKEVGDISPGPAKYLVKGQLDEYGLGQKIANVKIPKTRLPRDWKKNSKSKLDVNDVFTDEESEPALLRNASSPL